MIDWTDAQTRILINERKNRNVEYHNLGRDRLPFWESIAIKINEEHNTHFDGYQCKKKFTNLIRDYNLMCDFLDGAEKGRRTRNGTLYYNEFQTHFWERRNTSNTNAPDLQPPSYADATNAQQVNENNPDNEINATGNSDSMSVAD
ncbi:333_t:CDS:2 [Entrophospora sp. SA101]|nr:333_t:CDS:2 [Entrophospora sp. SA101]